MHTPIDTTHWTEQEFLSFTMLYACEASANVTETECEWIKSKIGAEPFQTAFTAFETHSDAEMIQTLAALKNRFFPGASGLQQIHNHLVELFKSDGKFTAMEQHVLHEMDRLFNS